METEQASGVLTAPSGAAFTSPFFLLAAVLQGQKTASSKKSAQGNARVTEKPDLTSETALGCEALGVKNRDRPWEMWISPDPKRQFASPYAYGSNPVNSIDPDGAAQIVSRTLDLGPASNISYDLNHVARHDLVAFDEPQMVHGQLVPDWSLYAKGNMLLAQADFRADKPGYQYFDENKYGWVPDRYAVDAINKLEPGFKSYSVASANQCITFCSDVFQVASQNYKNEIARNPLLVDLVNDDD